MMRRTINFFGVICISGLLVTGCGNTGSGTPSLLGSAFILTTDYTTGSFAVVDADTKASSVNAGSVNSDAVARMYNGLVYVLNRFGADNVQVIDPTQNYATTLQFSVGSGANPHDMVFASDSKAFITRYDTAEIWVVNPTTGEKTGEIDLSAYADSDGIPEASRMYMTGGKLYVAIQRLDRNSFFAPAGGSLIAVIDVLTSTVETTITLPFQNPVGAFSPLPNGMIVIACVGDYMAQDGGIVVIDPVNGTATVSAMTESIAGGDFSGLVMVSNNEGFLVVSDSSFVTSLVKVNISTGSVTTVAVSTGYSFFGMAVTGGELWISDRDYTNPGIRIFDVDSGAETTENPISTGLPPFEILFI